MMILLTENGTRSNCHRLMIKIDKEEKEWNLILNKIYILLIISPKDNFIKYHKRITI